jgi:hypothetical protein
MPNCQAGSTVVQVQERYKKKYLGQANKEKRTKKKGMKNGSEGLRYSNADY